MVGFEDRYTIGKTVLGKGAFSEVYACAKKGEDAKASDLAVKVIDKKKLKKFDDLKRELDLLRELSHPSILHLVDIFDKPDTCLIVTERLRGGELFEQIIEQGSYSEVDAANVLTQVLEAISYLHTVGIVHRDLKPENLLCRNPENPLQDIVICDFGLAKKTKEGEKLKVACGTPGYAAPEILTHMGYGFKVDIFAVGVIAYILLVGFPPFFSETDDNKEIIQMTIKGQWDFDDEDWQDVSLAAKDFIVKTMELNPDARIDAQSALEHKWLCGHAGSSVNIQRRVSVKLRKHFARKKWKAAINAQRAMIRLAGVKAAEDASQ